MDVYYMSDSIHYGSYRNPLYRDYEKFPYGTLENPLNSPPKSSHHQQQRNGGGNNLVQGKSKGKSSKESCPFCKEQKKRPLGAYLRKRGQRIHSESISEDVEECTEEQEECLPGDIKDSVAGSPCRSELETHDDHHHHHSQGGVVCADYSRQDSQNSGGK